MSKPIFIEVDSPPPETEDLIVSSLDDYKYGLSADYVNSAGLEQLSSFFI